MQLIELRKLLSPYSVFSLRDIWKIIPTFNRIQLDRWEKKKYLRKIKKGFYGFTDTNVDENFLFYTANKIYSPSYVSLEKALKFYGFIPDEIFQITSVSTKKTADFETTIGSFSYRQISPSLFFGYKIFDHGLVAEPEKAALDYLYLNSHVKTSDDFLEMRINKVEFLSQIDLEKFHRYLEAFRSKALSKRAEIFLNTIKND